MSKFIIQTFNKIAKEGLANLDEKEFNIQEGHKNPDAIILRSKKLHDYPFSKSTLAVGRAGAGTNNIPVDLCTKNGIVVFNTPGANANAVKEIVLLSLFLSSRLYIEGLNFSKSLVGKGVEVPEIVEQNKSQYKGFEITGKNLGVIGLGAIGMMVANDADSLGLNVSGYDPYLSINQAWALSRSVKHNENIKDLLKTSDFVTLHVPLVEGTQQFFNQEKFKMMKNGSVLLNFSRSEIVHEGHLIKALDAGQIGHYFTDFPTEKLLKHDKVVCFPHLGASTAEAEKNCAVMVARQIREYLLNGNIRNSVNYPQCFLERQGESRLALGHLNIPNMVGQITAILAQAKLNIIEMMNKSRGEIAYTILDIEKKVPESITDTIKGIKGIQFVRNL